MKSYLKLNINRNSEKDNIITNGGSLDGSVVKNPPAKAGDSGSIPVLARSPGVGNGNPLQYSCLGNPMEREAWQATVYWVAKELDTTQHSTAITKGTGKEHQSTPRHWIRIRSQHQLMGLSLKHIS